MSTIKRGDVAALVFDLGATLAGYSSARVIIASRAGAEPIVDRAGAIDGQTVTISLTAEETAVVGDYRCEVEMTPGPHTYPTSGYVDLSIVPDLG